LRAFLLLFCLPPSAAAPAPRRAAGAEEAAIPPDLGVQPVQLPAALGAQRGGSGQLDIPKGWEETGDTFISRESDAPFISPGRAGALGRGPFPRPSPDWGRRREKEIPGPVK